MTDDKKPITPQEYAEHLLGSPFTDEELRAGAECIERRQAARLARSKAEDG